MGNRLWLIVAALLCVAVLGLGWLLGVSPVLDQMNTANSQRETIEANNKVLESKVAKLKAQFANIDEFKTQLAEAQLGLPPGDELSTFLGQLHQLESSSGATLTEFAASEGESYVAAPGAKTDPLVTAENFVAVTIDLTVTGTRAQVINFVSDLQYGERMFLVTKLTIDQEQNVGGSDQEAKSDNYQGTITGYVYVLIDPTAPPPTPTPVGSLDTEPTPSPSAAP